MLMKKTKRVMLVWSKWKIRLVLHSWWENHPVKKMPLNVVGKTKNPEWFKLVDGTRPTLQYKNQASAWFDKNIHCGGFSTISGHITSALKAMWTQCFFCINVQTILFLMKKNPSYQSGFSFSFYYPMWLIHIYQLTWVLFPASKLDTKWPFFRSSYLFLILEEDT